MARKITLTVPDPLYQKIDKWRSAFNLSRIFQEAVSEAIRRKEDFQKRLGEESGFNEVIQRLKREKYSWEEKLFRNAEKEGRRWAARAHYEDLLVAASVPMDEIVHLPALQTPISETLEQLSHLPAAAAGELENFRETVLRGWKQGVNEFWEMVRDKI